MAARRELQLVLRDRGAAELFAASAAHHLSILLPPATPLQMGAVPGRHTFVVARCTDIPMCSRVNTSRRTRGTHATTYIVAERGKITSVADGQMVLIYFGGSPASENVCQRDA